MSVATNPASEAADGPAVVAVGGGHGLAASLRALLHLSPSLTAVVSVADDGGSSGRLQRSSPQPSPGDIRKCLAAVADPGSLLGASLNFRFAEGELGGHAVGNLLISALSETSGSFVGSIEEVARLVGARARIFPATESDVVLIGFTGDGREVAGQVSVMATAGIERVCIEPSDAVASSQAVEAIIDADVVVVGPGSLYTSVLAATAVPGIGDAIRATDAPVVYVSNLRAQPGESAGYNLVDHVAALHRHGIMPDAIVVDPSTMSGTVDEVLVVEAPLAVRGVPGHDEQLLADALRVVFRQILG